MLQSRKTDSFGLPLTLGGVLPNVGFARDGSEISIREGESREISRGSRSLTPREKNTLGGCAQEDFSDAKGEMGKGEGCE